MITKTTFCNVIEKFRQQMYLDQKNGEIIQEMFGCNTRCSYRDNFLVEAIMELLWVHFPKDEDGFCAIEHYCLFLEFGKIGEDLQTPEELYDLLISNKK